MKTDPNGTPDDSRKSLQTGLSTERRAKLQEILVKIALGYFQPQPTREMLAAQVAAWHEILIEIPTPYLQRCYESAARGHEGTYALTVSEVARAWRDVVSGEARHDRLAREAAERQAEDERREGERLTPEEMRETIRTMRRRGFRSLPPRSGSFQQAGAVDLEPPDAEPPGYVACAACKLEYRSDATACGPACSPRLASSPNRRGRC
jgi:hypothetical protein